MKTDAATPWAQVGELIAERTGLHFPHDRLDDLRRHLGRAAEELGFADAPACADWLLSAPLSPAEFQILVDQLTVGETYFFRDGAALQALSGRVLPELIERRRAEGRRQLRFWSAACCTGEEVYTLAILLREIVPDLADWDVTLIGTDLNARFLCKARAGIYGSWSFRTTPAALKARYFRPTHDGRFEVDPEIRGMVRFAQANLVADAVPAVPGSSAFDVVLCRNVLMYFTSRQVRRVIAVLRAALMPDGWLLVSPSETSRALFAGFQAVDFPGATFFRNGAEPAQPCAPPPGPLEDSPTRLPVVASVRADPPAPRPLSPPPLPLSSPGLPATPSPAPGGADESTFSARVRDLANAGRLADAHHACLQWLAADKLNAGAHYLSAVIQIEQGAVDAAAAALRRAVYLRPDFALAHVLLGSLATGRGATAEAGRHFANARRLLARAEPDEAVPEADGLTARRLIATLGGLAAGAAPR